MEKVRIMDKSLWKQFGELNRKYHDARDNRVGRGEWCRSESSKLKADYDRQIADLESEYKKKLHDLEVEKANALKTVTRSSDYYGAIESEESSKKALQSVASELVANEFISNKDMCDILSSTTGRLWKILNISGPAIYDAVTRSLEDRVGIVCVNHEDPQFSRKVYLTKTDATPNTVNCKVLLEGGIEDSEGFVEKTNNLNWTAILIDYMSGATDFQRTVNGIVLAPTDMKVFRSLILDSLAAHLGIISGGKTKE